MSWRTSSAAIFARNLGRKLGVNKLLAGLILGKEYEESYDRAFMGTIRPGDRVWDVGANIGYYTVRFAERVGEAGRVFAFEPSPTNFERLREASSRLEQIQLLNVGLGSEDSELSFEQGGDDLGATSRIVEGDGGLKVQVRTASGLLEEGAVEPPNVLKIDTEGFEWEVIDGFGDRIREASLRSIGIEVHFRILQERGLADAPARLERLLGEAGFQTSWPDPSHLLATKPDAQADPD